MREGDENSLGFDENCKSIWISLQFIGFRQYERLSQTRIWYVPKCCEREANDRIRTGSWKSMENSLWGGGLTSNWRLTDDGLPVGCGRGQSTLVEKQLKCPFLFYLYLYSKSFLLLCANSRLQRKSFTKKRFEAKMTGKHLTFLFIEKWFVLMNYSSTKQNVPQSLLFIDNNYSKIAICGVFLIQN